MHFKIEYDTCIKKILGIKDCVSETTSTIEVNGVLIWQEVYDGLGVHGGTCYYDTPEYCFLDCWYQAKLLELEPFQTFELEHLKDVRKNVLEDFVNKNNPFNKILSLKICSLWILEYFDFDGTQDTFSFYQNGKEVLV
jgi:hypothetical protein